MSWILYMTSRRVQSSLAAEVIARMHTTVCYRRLGSQDVPVKVRLEVDWQPERYQLSQGLASLLGMELETRARVIEVRNAE